jgi:hemerythrin
MKTAVEWLYNNLKSHFEHDGDLLEVVQFSFKQAKKMEEEQIVKHSVELTKILISNPLETSGKTPTELMDNYFNKTFKQ